MPRDSSGDVTVWGEEVLLTPTEWVEIRGVAKSASVCKVDQPHDGSAETGNSRLDQDLNQEEKIQ